MVKKVCIIHGWGGSSSSEPWFDWLKKELVKKRFHVEIFNMPNTDHPKIEEWVSYFEKNIKDVDEETYFVGHSIGCQTIMRFLEKLHKHKKIAGCVFVAPWFDLINQSEEELEIAHPWIHEKIDFERVLDHCNNFLTIFSNNDPYVHLDEVNKFKSRLDARIIIKRGLEHFNEVNEIPEILKFIK
ncbi:serine hydrolase family protein [Candidatus Pacearchaeota archaeon]|nr:serine hydrolase family protein [Candidatus Pacearchaeota archaeon]